MKKVFVTLMALLLCAAGLLADNPHSDYVWVAVPDHANWIYKSGDKPVIEIQLYKYGMPVVSQKIKVTEGTILLEPEYTDEITVKNGKAVYKMHPSKRAGFREVTFDFVDPVSGKSHWHHITVGFDPDKIKPYTQEPKDFKSFWDSELKKNKEIPAEYKVTRLEQFCNENHETYLVKMKVDNLHIAYGYLCKPVGAAAGSLPALFCPPGAGIKPIGPAMHFADDGYISVNCEIHGIDPMLDKEHYNEIYSAFKESRYHSYYSIGIESRERYYMKHVYLAMVRWIDFLIAQPEWDGKNVIAKGGSQGGGLSIVTAALDPRVTLCVPNYPALADMCAGADPKRSSGYPHYEREPEFLTETALKTLPYFDVCNFAKYVKCPTYMSWGFNDGTCPAECSYAVWNLLSCPKESLITPVNEHWTTEETGKVQDKWIKKHLK